MSFRSFEPPDDNGERPALCPVCGSDSYTPTCRACGDDYEVEEPRLTQRQLDEQADRDAEAMEARRDAAEDARLDARADCDDEDCPF